MSQPVLFRNILVVTPMPDGTVRSQSDACVAVADGYIRYVGTSESDARRILDSEASGSYETYDGSRKILWPAMANTHGHIPMTLMRNQADDANLHTWLFERIFPREKRLTPEHVRNGTLLGLCEMIRSGTGTAADMYYFGEAVVEAAVQAKIRLNVCCDAKAADASGKTHVVRQDLESFINLCHTVGETMIRPALLVHSIYLYEPDLYRELAQTAADLHCFVQVHIGETRQEVDECVARYGHRPAVQLFEFGFFQSPTVAAHCVFLDDEERRLLSDHNVLIAHCPTSNLKLGSGIANVPALLQSGLKVGLGTDGAASNNNLSLYQEMKLASLLAKGITGDAAVLPADTLIRMATVRAQEGLGFYQCGCIAPGYAADLQIVDADRPGMWPLGDPVAALVYSCESDAVESLMVAGNWLMRKRELLTLDEEKIKRQALQSAAVLNAFN
jgi:5-methylthioadenosine/S-adenosylhomocysteine deaminase